LPLEGLGSRFVAPLEGEEASLDLGEVGEVVGGQDLALDDGVVDLDLVQPRRMDGAVDEPQPATTAPGVTPLQAVDGRLAPVRRAVVDDPVHAAGSLPITWSIRRLKGSMPVWGSQ